MPYSVFTKLGGGILAHMSLEKQYFWKLMRYDTVGAIVFGPLFYMKEERSIYESFYRASFC